MINNAENRDNEDEHDELVWPFDGYQVQQLLCDPLVFCNPIYRSNLAYVWSFISSSDPYSERPPEV